MISTYFEILPSDCEESAKRKVVRKATTQRTTRLHKYIGDLTYQKMGSNKDATKRRWRKVRFDLASDRWRG